MREYAVRPDDDEDDEMPEHIQSRIYDDDCEKANLSSLEPICTKRVKVNIFDSNILAFINSWALLINTI